MRHLCHSDRAHDSPILSRALKELLSKMRRIRRHAKTFGRLSVLKLVHCPKTVATGSLFLVLALAMRVAWPAQKTPPPPPLLPPASGFSFPENTTLTYSVDWRVFPAGRATFHLQRSGDMERIAATGETTGVVNVLFRVNDHYISYLNRTTGCSTSFNKVLQEGRRRVTSSLRFFSVEKKQIFDQKNLVTGTVEHKEGPIPGCVTDLMSAIFYGGSQPLVPGHDYHMPLADSMRVVDVTMKPEAVEEISTAAGTFQTIRVQPTASEGVVKHRGTIQIWYTTDARHIPVQMRVRLFFGTLTLRLASLVSK